MSENIEPDAGKDLGENTFTCTTKMVDDYCVGLAVDPSRYEDTSAWGEPAAPAMIVGDVDGGFNGARFSNAFGNLWMRQEWEFNQPIFCDREYRRTSRVMDVYEWRNRTVVKQLIELFDDSGEPVVRGTHHQSYLLSQTSGKVALRDPTKKEGVRKFDIPEGERIDSVERAIDLEMCGVFFHGDKNYHTDKTASEELGFEEVVVGGKMTMSLIGDMLESRFGEGYYKDGALDVKFTNITWPNDNVPAHGVITPREAGKAHLKVWMEKDDGTVVIVGSASAAES